MCAEAGLVKVRKVALDGTKMKANASLAANRTLAHLTEEVATMLKQAEAADREEDRKYGKDKCGDELPDDLQQRASRLKRLQECKERLEREQQEARETQEEKIAAREAKEEATGQKLRGRKPKAPEDAVNTEAKANVTDPESRILKTQKGYVQGYNAQAVVTEDQVIVAAEVTQEENDVHQLHAILEKATENCAAVEAKADIGVVLADAGYWSEENATRETDGDMELLIATAKDWKQRKAMRELPPPRGPLPKKLTAQARMERLLRTKRGRALHALRSQLVEQVFGQIKDGRRGDRFMRRGFPAAQSGWALLCTTHNLLKLWRSGKAHWLN